MAGLEHLCRFVQGMTQVVEQFGAAESAMLRAGRMLLAELIARDDRLPQEFAQPDPDTIPCTWRWHWKQEPARYRRPMTRWRTARKRRD